MAGNWRTQGQEAAIAYIEGSWRTGRLSHAYLFVGPRGVGKGTLALDLAMAVNCDGPSTGRTPPCGECRSCRRILAGHHADVEVIAVGSATDAAAEGTPVEISIDQVRGMQQRAALEPFEGRMRVFIVDGAESLSAEASDALLKVLEEPPPKVMLVLLTERAASLTATVRSRCQTVELRPLPLHRTEAILRQHFGADTETARRLARWSKGCLGGALRALEDETLIAESARQGAQLLALVGASTVERLRFAAATATGFGRDREATFELIGRWLEVWHDLLYVKCGFGDAVVHDALAQDLAAVAGRLTLSQIVDFIHQLLMLQQELDANANPRLALEVLALSSALLPRREERAGIERSPLAAPDPATRNAYDSTSGRALQEGRANLPLRPRGSGAGR